MKTINVNEASGIVLDWLVAMCEGWEQGKYMKSPDVRRDAHGSLIGLMVPIGRGYVWFKPSTDWSQGGPIIERERIHVTPFADDPGWFVDRASPFDYIEGPTLLIAAMRCYVASKMGTTAEVPEELAT